MLASERHQVEQESQDLGIRDLSHVDVVFAVRRCLGLFASVGRGAEGTARVAVRRRYPHPDRQYRGLNALEAGVPRLLATVRGAPDLWLMEFSVVETQAGDLAASLASPTTSPARRRIATAVTSLYSMRRVRASVFLF